jgi:SNF2 family DNA or RNA helicase
VKVQIELKNKNFYLHFDNTLTSPIKFQLKYYGFKEYSENERVYVSAKENIKIENLLEYFNEFKIQFNLCEFSNAYLDNLINQKNEKKKKISFLKKIKKDISKEEIDLFSKSITYLKRKLLPYQIESLYHLQNAQSAANFSVPGSGKTSVILAYYEKLKLDQKVNAIFLIGPKNCFYSWKTEFIKTIGRDPKLCILDGKVELNDRVKIYKSPAKNELYALHYSILAKDIDYLKIFATKNKFLIVIDEAHNIKKIDGKWSNAAFNLSHLSNYKVVLTGTPMPNQLKDFYNYIDFLYGDNEIINLQDKAKIEILVEKNNFNEASNILKDKFSPFYTRVTKKDLNLSKPIFNKPILIQMNEIEKKIYDAIISKMKNYPIKQFEHNIELINNIRRARILRLRQNCSYVKNLLSAIPNDIKEGDENLTEGIASLIASYDSKETPAKIEKLKELVLPLVSKKKKVLIWSTHIATIDLIKKHMLRNNVNIKVIIGPTKLEDRENIKDEFNDQGSNLDAIVANPQACSESISLHKACQNAIYYDQNYNAAEFLQSLDRIHRVGGSETKPVYYDFLQYSDSIDEKIFSRLFEKANRQMQVLEEENILFNLISVEEDWKSLYNDLKI